ncbi:hypothetical protein ACFL4G_10480 [Thermodesulfobacteriota bacterium]
MRKLLASSLVIITTIIGCSKSIEYNYDGLYLISNNGYKYFEEKDIHFCKIRPKGSISYMRLLSLSDTPTIKAPSDQIISVKLSDIKEIHLKGNYTNDIRLSYGTNIMSWEKLGFSGFESPCNTKDDKNGVWNFKHRIEEPLNKSTEDAIVKYFIKESALSEIKSKYNEFQDMPFCILIWEAVKGRKVDKGWLFIVTL